MTAFGFVASIVVIVLALLLLETLVTWRAAR
jgi:hypothetical protein